MTHLQQTFDVPLEATEIGARQAIVRIITHLSECGIPKPVYGDIEIALAEAVNNTVEHACAGLPEASGRITCQIKQHAVVIEISDNGRPLPAHSLPKGAPADISGSIADLPEGGFGWFLIRQITTGLTYSREHGRNRLILEFGHPEMPNCHKAASIAPNYCLKQPS